MGVEDTRLMKALGIIRRDFSQVLGLPELAAAVGLSQNQLSRLFTQHLGGSVPDEINRVRIDAARRRLSDTNDSVKEIAALSGFSSANYFNKVFKEHTAQRPLAFRNANRAKPIRGDVAAHLTPS